MQELVVESLVVSLAMVVFYVLVDETTQMPLAERDHACETLLFDRPDEPLGIQFGDWPGDHFRSVGETPGKGVSPMRTLVALGRGWIMQRFMRQL